MRFTDSTVRLSRAEMRTLLAFTEPASSRLLHAIVVFSPALKSAWASARHAAVWTAEGAETPAPATSRDQVVVISDDLRPLAKAPLVDLDLGARTWTTLSARGVETGRGALGPCAITPPPIGEVWPSGPPAATAPRVRGDLLRLLGALGAVAGPLELIVRDRLGPLEVRGVDPAAPFRAWRAIAMPEY